MRRLLALGLLLPLVACAGRVPDPIEVEQANDFSLSCPVLAAEHEGNEDKYGFLEDRDADEVAKNLSVGVMAFTLTPLAFFGLDLSNANQKEMDALMERRERLEGLMASRGCHVQNMAPGPYRAYVREERLYVDEHGRQINLPVNHFVYSRRGADRVAVQDQNAAGF